MDSDIIDVVAEWESTPVSGGYGALHDLADREFTGAVSEGSVWAFVLNGKVIGVFDGDIEAFADAEATAYRAPDPALPLLYAMQAGDSETRAKYYSNDTPLSAADATLSSGNFTGYVELSENVLSGDYYVVYYGGKSMSVAFVGNNRTLLAGEEAFERADDEVGIYRVNEASVDIVELPEPPRRDEPTGSAAVDRDATDASNAPDAPGEASSDADSPAAESDVAAEADERTSTADVARDAPRDEPDPGDTVSDDEVPAETATERSERADDGETTPAEPTDVPRAAADQSDPVGGADSIAGESASTPEPVPEAAAESAHEDRTPPFTDDAAVDDASADTTVASTPSDADEDVFSEEAEWREATSIPALDPKESGTGDAEDSDATSPSSAAISQRARKRRRQRSQSSTQQRRRPDAQSAARPEQRPNEEGESQRGDVDRLEAQLQAATEAKEELETARERVAAERDDYREEVERLQSRVSELEAEVERLETELEAARSESSASSAPQTATESMSAEAALDGTNLFVRYGTKSGGTLEKAHEGESERAAVNENLRLEHHTGFETDGVVVDGDSYETFLHDSIEYGFVRWAVEDLLYEIRETGNQGHLDELFDAIPKVDRAEIHGDVTLKYTDGGEEHREQQTFDVVLRDRMGNPLVVANVNDSRDPATEETMTSLIENASRLRESNESLGAAFLVTASYFEPAALETAADATGGGLLSRGRRKSFVKLSRKQGFHLCLVETRNGDFHLNVPEL
ncbi:hypothetical protein SAMN04487948_109111 [Halogranum amylolyticum]|uniref:DUF7527 domain-containing protein n=1 Tax=Halogranum amylolyticum TaxID=660520 RepID=A0A1H8U3S0_9EURY|nr:hypothetical protein [Halogranum amylolyticum]SEO97706.1 hypothetical protein SAMN04487948_109111 [Halogranum amylolyticum]